MINSFVCLFKMFGLVLFERLFEEFVCLKTSLCFVYLKYLVWFCLKDCLKNLSKNKSCFVWYKQIKAIHHNSNCILCICFTLLLRSAADSKRMPFVLGDSRDVYIHIISRFEVKEWRPLDYQMCYLQNTHIHTKDREEES